MVKFAPSPAPAPDPDPGIDPAQASLGAGLQAQAMQAALQPALTQVTSHSPGPSPATALQEVSIDDWFNLPQDQKEAALDVLTVPPDYDLGIKHLDQILSEGIGTGPHTNDIKNRIEELSHNWERIEHALSNQVVAVEDIDGMPSAAMLLALDKLEVRNPDQLIGMLTERKDSIVVTHSIKELLSRLTYDKETSADIDPLAQQVRDKVEAMSAELEQLDAVLKADAFNDIDLRQLDYQSSRLLAIRKMPLDRVENRRARTDMMDTAKELGWAPIVMERIVSGHANQDFTIDRSLEVRGDPNYAQVLRVQGRAPTDLGNLSPTQRGLYHSHNMKEMLEHLYSAGPDGTRVILSDNISASIPSALKEVGKLDEDLEIARNRNLANQLGFHPDTMREEILNAFDKVEFGRTMADDLNPLSYTSWSGMVHNAMLAMIPKKQQMGVEEVEQAQSRIDVLDKYGELAVMAVTHPHLEIRPDLSADQKATLRRTAATDPEASLEKEDEFLARNIEAAVAHSSHTILHSQRGMTLERTDFDGQVPQVESAIVSAAFNNAEWNNPRNVQDDFKHYKYEPEMQAELVAHLRSEELPLHAYRYIKDPEVQADFIEKYHKQFTEEYVRETVEAPFKGNIPSEAREDIEATIENILREKSKQLVDENVVTHILMHSHDLKVEQMAVDAFIEFATPADFAYINGAQAQLDVITQWQNDWSIPNGWTPPGKAGPMFGVIDSAPALKEYLDWQEENARGKMNHDGTSKIEEPARQRLNAWAETDDSIRTSFNYQPQYHYQQPQISQATTTVSPKPEHIQSFDRVNPQIEVDWGFESLDPSKSTFELDFVPALAQVREDLNTVRTVAYQFPPLESYPQIREIVDTPQQERMSLLEAEAAQRMARAGVRNRRNEEEELIA